MKTQVNNNSDTRSVDINTRISEEEMVTKFMPQLFDEVIKQMATELMKEYVRDHAQEIFEKVNQEAIATMVVAQAGNAIKDMLDKKLPDKIVRETETQIYQKGLLGGMKRIK